MKIISGENANRKKRKILILVLVIFTLLFGGSIWVFRIFNIYLPTDERCTINESGGQPQFPCTAYSELVTKHRLVPNGSDGYFIVGNKVFYNHINYVGSIVIIEKNAGYIALDGSSGKFNNINAYLIDNEKLISFQGLDEHVYAIYKK